jgi:hypothetical protein
MTKTERRNAQLQRHYTAINFLLLACGIEKNEAQVKRVSSTLLRIENKAHQLAENYCNGKISTGQWGEISEGIAAEVQALFNGKLQGLKVNGDARGYAIKINDEQERTIYKDANLFRDWGGNGLLAPEIDGN